MLPNLSGLCNRNVVRTGANDDDNSFEALVEHLKEHSGKESCEVFGSIEGRMFRKRNVPYDEWQRAMKMAGKKERGSAPEPDPEEEDAELEPTPKKPKAPVGSMSHSANLRDGGGGASFRSLGGHDSEDDVPPPLGMPSQEEQEEAERTRGYMPSLAEMEARGEQPKFR